MTSTNTFGTRGYTIGTRVESHPGTDCWMMGDRYGDVVKVGRTLIHVKMDRSGKVRRFHPDNIERIARNMSADTAQLARLAHMLQGGVKR